MITLNPRSKEPIYVQIMDQLVLFISTGVLEAGSKLPSIRELASDLGINPNTVARAYTELEQRGIIETIPKKGAFITNRSFHEEIEAKAKLELTETFLQSRKYGLSWEKIREIAKEALTDAEHSESEQEL